MKEQNRKETAYSVTYGYLPVRLPGCSEQLWMLVAKGFGQKPMMLLTTQPLRRNRKVLWRILRCYMKRWSIEETIRFVKQGYDLENIRVLTYRRLRKYDGAPVGRVLLFGSQVGQRPEDENHDRPYPEAG